MGLGFLLGLGCGCSTCTRSSCSCCNSSADSAGAALSSPLCSSSCSRSCSSCSSIGSMRLRHEEFTGTANRGERQQVLMWPPLARGPSVPREQSSKKEVRMLEQRTPRSLHIGKVVVRDPHCDRADAALPWLLGREERLLRQLHLCAFDVQAICDHLDGIPHRLRHVVGVWKVQPTPDVDFGVAECQLVQDELGRSREGLLQLPMIGQLCPCLDLVHGQSASPEHQTSAQRQTLP
mmetsp:Transcript_22282/g.48726  ORF Transcript_22282/g.48726 Transcript_22282/m.48726 type:complete len:235 (+) Transcript_22282:538-1242(+)